MLKTEVTEGSRFFKERNVRTSTSVSSALTDTSPEK